MLTLKGNKDGHRQQAMAKALGGGPKNTPAHKLDSAANRYRKEQMKRMGQQEVVMIRGKTEQRRLGEESEPEDNSSDDDSDWDDDDDAAFAALREKRLQAMKKKAGRDAEFRSMGHGQYTQLAEDEFLPAVTASKYVICHFFHKDFERCKVMDKHLGLLCPRYLPTRFIRVDAEKTPFFVGKLQLRVLPTVVLFKDGVAVDRIVGFEGLGGDGSDFTTRSLEKRIANSGVIVMLDELHKKAEKEFVNSIRRADNGGYNSDDEYDSA